MIAEVGRRIAVVAADHMAIAGKLALIALVLTVTVVIVPQLIFSQTDLVRTLPASALGVFVWRADTRLHQEIRRRLTGLRWHGLDLTSLLTLPAHEFALIGEAEPWRATLFINLKRPEGLTEFGRLRSGSDLVIRPLGGGRVALAGTREQIEEALYQPIKTRHRALVRRALISAEGAVFSSSAADILRISSSSLGLEAKGVKNETPLTISMLRPIIEDHFPTNKLDQAEIAPLFSLLNKGSIDFAALGKLKNITPPQKMIFDLFYQLFPSGIRLINQKNEFFIYF